jgi:hypothetical protein
MKVTDKKFLRTRLAPVESGHTKAFDVTGGIHKGQRSNSGKRASIVTLRVHFLFSKLTLTQVTCKPRAASCLSLFYIMNYNAMGRKRPLYA